MMDSKDGELAYIQRRNRELGQVLKKAREIAGLLQRDCAERLGTYRQRYAAIERGEEAVGAAELEVLVRYLKIPRYAAWPAERDAPTQADRLVYVQQQEGESVQIIVGPYAADVVPSAYSRQLTEVDRRVEPLHWSKPPEPSK